MAAHWQHHAYDIVTPPVATTLLHERQASPAADGRISGVGSEPADAAVAAPAHLHRNRNRQLQLQQGAAIWDPCHSLSRMLPGYYYY